MVVDATHLHPPSTKLVGADGGLSALTAVSTEGAFDARLLALTALANCLEVDLEDCRRFECAPLAARLAALLKTIGFEDDSDDWRVEDVLEAAHCAVPLACVARREAGRTKGLAALTGAAVAPTALAKLLEALAVVQARSGALDRDAAAALAVLVRDLRKPSRRAGDAGAGARGSRRRRSASRRRRPDVVCRRRRRAARGHAARPRDARWHGHWQGPWRTSAPSRVLHRTCGGRVVYSAVVDGRPRQDL